MPGFFVSAANPFPSSHCGDGQSTPAIVLACFLQEQIMRITDARRLRGEPSPRGFRTLCRFNLEAVDGLLILDCSLIQAPRGNILVYGPPSKNNGQLLCMAPEMRRSVITMALDAVGIDEHEFCSAA
jgi:hypothetical protein